MCVCAPACCNSTGTKTKLKARKEASLHNLQATHNSRASTVVCRVLDPPPPFHRIVLSPHTTTKPHVHMKLWEVTGLL